MDTHPKDSRLGFVYSDIEEGEIPEFEITESAINNSKNALSLNNPSLKFFDSREKWDTKGTISKNMSVGLQIPSNSCSSESSVSYKKSKLRYASPPSEGECFSEDEGEDDEEEGVAKRKFDRNYMMQKNLGYHGSSIFNSRRRSNYLRPFQSTCGSVEDIMTKIGETLGRSNNSYYSRRKLKVTDRCIDTCAKPAPLMQEPNPLIKRLKMSSYYSKRGRHGESNADGSESDIMNKDAKVIISFRNMEKTKRKRRETSDLEVSPKYKTGGRSEKDWYEGTKCSARKRGFDSAAKEKVASSNGVIYVPSKRDGEENGRGSDLHMDENVDECSTARNSSEVSERLSVNNEEEGEPVQEQEAEEVDEDEEDDDDIELIKLRLLALTSNKKKCQTGEGILNKTEDAYKVNDTQKASDGLKGDSDQEPWLENASLDSVRDTIIKPRDDSDIDRYELLLRAEALKTALIKKHRNRIRQKSILPQDDNTSNDSCGVTDFGHPLEATFRCDPEMKSNEIPQVSESSETYHVAEYTGKSDQPCNASCKSPSQSEVLTQPWSPEAPVQVPPVSDTQSLTDSTGVQRKRFTENQSLKKRRRKIGRNKKRRDFDSDELNIKENNGGLDNEPDDVVKATRLSDGSKMMRREKDHHERKFVLIDSLQTSNYQEPGPLASTDRRLVLGPKNVGEEITEPASDASGQGRNGTTRAVNEVQRIIVHLGSESSDEESASELSQTKSERTGTGEVTKNVEIVNPQALHTAAIDTSSQILSYEKSVELLLEEARRRIESNSQVPSSKVPSTPEAVYSHLAPSQRLEYMRLKQKIAERERMKEAMARNACHWQGVNGSGLAPDGDGTDTGLKTNRSVVKAEPPSNTSLKVTSTRVISVGDTSSRLKPPCISSVKKVIHPGRGDSTPVANKVEKTRLIRVRSEPKSTAALKKENGALTADLERSILERRKILTQNKLNLERLKILWKEIKMEKMIEGKYEKELKKLKVQQKLFELKVSQQRVKIKKLAEETKQIYEAFQRNNKGMEASAKKRKSIFREKTAPDPAPDRPPPPEGEPHPSGTETSEGSIVEQTKGEETEGVESGKSTEPERKTDDNNVADNKDSKVARTANPYDLKEYNSPLQMLNIGSGKPESRVDPNAIMCHFDLLGKCNDEECLFQHWRT